MAKRDLRTRHGFNFYDMASMLQKAIRRGDIKRAAFAARELYDKYYKYVWKRLLVISAEDCYGIMTKEILALKAADDVANENKTTGHKDTIFLAKAVVLLCIARKNRDACYVACNLFNPKDYAEYDALPICDDIDSLSVDHIPDWVYDKHTIIGKKRGKDGLDMVNAEQEALFPLQRSIFDDADWYGEFSDCKDQPKLERWLETKKTTDECIEEYFGKGVSEWWPN